MARRTLCTLLSVIGLSITAWAQSAATPVVHAPETSAAPLVFGDSDVALASPWRFQVGDSPVDPATGALKWAQPDFDDSKWETTSLKPMPNWSDPYNGDPRYIPGWTATGHPNYMGYAWYRLRVAVTVKPGVQLALACPIYVDDGYQVFANGQLLGGYGKFENNGKSPTVFSTGPKMLVLPETAAGADGGERTEVIAFRVWMGSMGFTHSPYAGGLHYAPYLGAEHSIASRTRLDWLELVLESAYAPFECVLLLLLGLVAANLLWFDRSDHVYLWVAAVLVFTALVDGALTVYTLRQVLTQRTYFMFFDVFANPLVLCGWMMVWWRWFDLRRPAWMPKAIGGLMLLYMVTKAIGGDFFYGADLHAPVASFNVISVVVRLLFLPLLVMIIGLGIRRQGVEGWLVLPAVAPLVVSQFASELIVLDLPVKWSVHGITVFVGQVANLIAAAAISVLLLRRLLLSVHRQRRMAQDVRQAQEVQSVILREARTVLDSMVIECEFRPADQVGGDFFQVMPDPVDDSLAIVFGDVNGKGLRAGMLVALLVGATRTALHFSPDPDELLRALNERLMGRGNVSATCMALRISHDGEVYLANAGQTTPYLNGEPIQLDGSFPLGLVKKAEFTEARFQLRENDRLVLLSDGAAEARDAHGKLFGFDRVQKMLLEGKTVEEVADAAQTFGQQDDISAITVTWTAAG
ncbi:MAG TPA: PP2C family protein-serine/threonine phosphatase [Terracidiphilus sp.]|nr:PP2C family protein-serine/threonine phosphatase [Terracidiphilus sp.]